MNKQLLFLSLAAALFTGCSKEAAMPDGSAPATHISAKATGAKSPDTKAPLEGISLNGLQAQVFTTTSPLDNFTGDKTKMFTNAYASGVMTFADNSYSQYDPASLSGKALLPTDKSEIYLYGFYPTGWTTAGVGAYESLSHTFDGKTDLMTTWLTAADQQKIAYQGGTSGTTPDKADFMFRHLLTCYNIRVVGADADQVAAWGRIKSVAFKDATVNKVSTGENFGYTYSAGGGAVSFYKLAGTIAVPTYSDVLFEKTAFADMLTPTTTAQPACYAMAAPVTVDADTATAELTLVVSALDKDGGAETIVEIPMSLDQSKFTANGNSTRGYTVSVTLSFTAQGIMPTASIGEWAAGATYDQELDPVVPPPAIGALKDGGIVYEVTDAKNYKVFSLTEGSSLAWSAGNYVLGAGDGRDETDGKKNMSAIKAYFDANMGTVGSDFAVAFPAAGFCDAMNTGGVSGWYLPAVNELVALYTAYTANKVVLDKAIMDNSGTAMASGYGYFWSGTEDSMLGSNVWYVKFSGGSRDRFGKIMSGFSVRCVNSITPPPPSIGDVKDNGVVYYVKGANYKVVSVAEAPSTLAWADGGYAIGSGAQSDTDGKGNAAAIKFFYDTNPGYIISEPTFDAAFPAAAWCYNYKGKDGTDPVGTWYLPAKTDLQYLWCAFNGKAPISWADDVDAAAPEDAAAQAVFNKYLTDAGGTNITTSEFLSGTEVNGSDDSAWNVFFSYGGTYLGNKRNSYYVRCVRDL